MPEDREMDITFRNGNVGSPVDRRTAERRTNYGAREVVDYLNGALGELHNFGDDYAFVDRALKSLRVAH